MNVRVLAEGHGSVTIGWDVPAAEVGQPSASGYRVYFREAIIEPGVQPDLRRSWSFWPDRDVGWNARMAQARDLTPDIWYELTVAAVHDGGRVWSQESVVAYSGSRAPAARLAGAPSDLRLTAGSSGSATMAWEPPTDDGGSPVTGYEVWYARSQDLRNTDGHVLSAVLSSTATQYTITGLVNYQSYRVRVAAVTEVGRGPFASEWATANHDDHNPAGLIAGHRFARAYSLDTDTWEVWVCDVADGHLNIDVGSAVALLNREIPPYFSWLSGGKYRPEFVAGGTVKAESNRSSDLADDYECDDRVAEVSRGGTEGAVIILDKDGIASYGGPGRWKGSFVDGIWQITPAAFPENERVIELTAGAVLPTSAYCSDCTYPDHIDLNVVAHEMGHALGWPHSYGGNRPETYEAFLEVGIGIDEYDNPMDMVSGSSSEWELGRHGLVAGTIAANRYAAGWIDAGEIAIHREPDGSYMLAPIGISGTQMLVLPTGEPGHFISLGARVAKGYDAGIPAEGVEVYRIDQRATVCADDPPENPGRLSCVDTDRRTQQVPPPPDDDRDVNDLTDHVYGPGEGLTIEGFRVDVVEQVSGRFRVTVEKTYKGTFADDENNVHEQSIDKLADAGVLEMTECGKRRICPDEPLLRRVMAVWITRAANESPTRGPSQSRFADVNPDAWWARYVELLADLQISAGCKTEPLSYCPDKPVTRAQMATFLVRAFDLDPAPPAGFADTAGSAHEANINALAATGITAGCKTEPLSYCPDKPVTRAQMATFLVRASAITS